MTTTSFHFNIDNCLVCGVDFEENQVSLTSLTNTSYKVISEFIEDVISVSLPPELNEVANICQGCFEQFNALDEHMNQVTSIKTYLINLFEQSNYQEEHLIEEDFIVEDEMKREDENIEATIIYEDVKDSNRVFLTSELIESTDCWSEDDSKRPHQCQICSRRFRENSKLKAHLLTHTDERKVVCDICGKAFKTAACVRSHKRIHSESRLTCDQCPKTFTTKSEFQRHKHDLQDLNCEYCSLKFNTKISLLSHLKTHSDTFGTRKHCPECSMTFPTNGKLNRHLKSHSKQYEHSCPICGKQFLYSYNVHAHIKQVHGGQKRSTPSIPCDICNKKFRNEHSLKQHLTKEHEYVEESDMIFEEELEGVEVGSENEEITGE